MPRCRTARPAKPAWPLVGIASDAEGCRALPGIRLQRPVDRLELLTTPLVTEAGERRPLARLVRVLTPLLVMTGIELSLGILGTLAAVVVGLDADLAITYFVIGAGFFAMIVVLRSSRDQLSLDDAVDLAPGAEIERAAWGEVLTMSVSSSVVGLAILSAIALTFNTQISALLAGLIAGKGLGMAANAAYIAYWEQRHGAALFRDLQTRRLLVAR